MLLWLLVLTGASAGAVAWGRRAGRDLVAWVVRAARWGGHLLRLPARAVSSPFATQPPVPDGAGMVPSLQNPYMLAHPPMLYLGYVGLTIPWAFAMGSLLAGRNDERWIVATRRWTLGAWAFLGVGQLLGAHWAYEEVGWGGYYAWDPVENAALMPWLAATAYLHSVMIQEKRGMLRLWNVSLVTLAFVLSLFGTFLTRSGILTSIHSFTQSSIGSWFLGFIVVVVAFSVTLISLAPAAAALPDAARVARLPRGDLPLQQPAARRALPDRPLGRALPDRLRGRPRHDAHHRPAVLQLLPARLRAAAAPADGDRADRGVASRLPALRGPGVRLALRLLAARRGGRCSRSAPARRSRACSRTPSPPSSSPRSRSSSRAARARGRPSAPAPGPARSRRSSRRTGAATAATSSTRRSSCSPSGSPARARTRPWPRCRHARARPSRSATTSSATRAWSAGRRRTRPRRAPRSWWRGTGATWARSIPARTAIPSRIRSPTRSPSAATSSPARTCS